VSRQRVGRDLARFRDDFLLHFDLRGTAGDVDLHLFERVVEVVEQSRVEVELVEGERDLLGAERSVSGGGLQQVARLVGLQDVRNVPDGPALHPCAHVPPLT